MTMTEPQGSTNSVRDALIGEVPVIEETSDVMVHLPRGVQLNNVWQSAVEVRELNGEDEEYLARFKDLNDYFDNVIARGVSRIGDIDMSTVSTAERIGVLGTLLIGEREQLMVAIARVTYGNQRTFEMLCPACREKFNFDLMLDEDIKFKKVDIVETFEVHTSDVDFITLRPLTGHDQMEILRHPGTDAEKNTLILTKAITLVNGKPAVNPGAYARALGMRMRAVLLKALADRQPSADMTLEIPCPACKEVSISTFAWWDLFRA